MEIEKINKYQNGKIYVIRSPSTDNIYIGSTVEKYLSNRFGGHKSKYKYFINGNGHNITSFNLIKLGDSYIELLEAFPCNSKLELCKREGELIREHKLNCVNKNIAGRDKKEYQKEYQIDNKETIKKYSKKYYKKYNIDNKETIKIYQKQYNIDNKETVKKYYTNNTDSIKNKVSKYRENNSEKIKCDCGSIYVKYNSSTHNKSIKHKNFLIL